MRLSPKSSAHAAMLLDVGPDLLGLLTRNQATRLSVAPLVGLVFSNQRNEAAKLTRLSRTGWNHRPRDQLDVMVFPNPAKRIVFHATYSSSGVRVGTFR